MYVLPHVAVATSNLPYLKYSQMTLTGESSFSAVWGLKLNFYILHKTILQLCVSRDFDHFLLKRFDLGPIWTTENIFANFFFPQDIHEKHMSA